MPVYKVEFIIETESMDAALATVNKPLGEWVSLEEIDPETGDVLGGIYPDDQSRGNN